MSDDKRNRVVDALNARGLAGKREYVRSLEKRSDVEALSLLVECLCDESWYLRDLAEEALLRLGGHGAPVLVPLLDQGLWFTRASAARVLGRAAHRPAVPGLLRLAGDGNAAVAESAREALAAVARHGGAASVARGIHALERDQRHARLDELAHRDRHLAERVRRLMEREELMSADHDLADDHAAVRAAEEGPEWEVLTGPSRSDPSAPAEPPRGEPTPD